MATTILDHVELCEVMQLGIPKQDGSKQTSDVCIRSNQVSSMNDAFIT